MVTISAILSFVFILVYFHFYQCFPVSRRTWIFIAYECIVGISLFFAFALFSEKYKVDIGKRIGLGLLGFCILGLHYYALPNWALTIDTTYFLRFFIFWVIFSLLSSFVLFYQEKEKLAFWQFNQYVFIQFFLSSAFSLALFVGIASALYAVEKLFDIPIADAFYVEGLAFFALVVNTLFFSASLPADLNCFREKQSFKKPLRLFIKYVLLPILLLYYLILMVYVGQIVLSGVLPKGNVALPILIFSSLGSLTFFLAYPFSYEKEHTSIRFFVRYFFYFMLPLLTMLVAALLTRVFDYGFTEYRYLGILMSLWFLISTFYTVLRERVSLVVFPISLFLLLLLGSVGPWGMFQLSARSQFMRLSRLLETNNLIEGKVLSVDKIPALITDSLSGEIGSINKFLFYREKIDLVYPILAENEKKQIDSIRSSDNKIYAFNKFLERTFHLPENERLPDYRRYHFYTNDFESFSTSTEGFSVLATYNFSSANSDLKDSLFLKNNVLNFLHKNDTLRYELIPYLDSLAKAYFAQPNLADLPFDEYVNIQASTASLTFESQNAKSKIILKEFLFGLNADSSAFVENASFYFLK